MITLTKKDKEVNIEIKLHTQLGRKPYIELTGEADLIHHLIEGVFDIVDRLSRMEGIGHQSKEWRDGYSS